jgi:hypothetical protein
MGITPFAVSRKLPDGTNAKLPKQRISAEERLRRLKEAIAFLRQHLAAGPQPAKVLIQTAKNAGIAGRTLHRAKGVLGVTTEHTGWHGQWVWRPPVAVEVASQAAIVVQ